MLHDPTISSAALALTETWLHDHGDAEIAVSGFQRPFRVDRKRKKALKGRFSGGVVMYVKDGYAAEKVFEFSSGVIECVGVMIDTLNLMTYTVYRQPDEPNHRSTSQHFSAFINQLKAHISSLPTPTPDIVLQGDFNLPNADWETGEYRPRAPKDEKKMIKALYELTLDNFMVQQVEGPTQISGNTLDLVFMNNAAMIHSIAVQPVNKPISDHSPIQTDVSYKGLPDEDEDESSNPDAQNTRESRWRRLNFHSPEINWEALSNDLSSHDWNREYRSCTNATEMNEVFSETCLIISERHVPRRSAKKKDAAIPRHRLRLMRNRARILRTLADRSTEQRARRRMEERLVEIEASLRVSRAEESALKESKAVDSIKSNPKFFFSYANKNSKVRTGIGPLRTAQRTLTNSPARMASILAEQYNSAFSKPLYDDTDPSTIFDDTPHQQSSDLLEFINFTDDDLAEAMRELRPNAAPGPDGFPAALLNKCSKALAPPLATAWRQSLNEGVVPETCKSALIVPIHKGKSKAVAKNYRPVALTSQLSKVFEKVVRRFLVSFMEANTLLNPTQHGFRAGRSCLSQLLNHFDTITHHLERGRGVDVVYLDFAKAFDKVDIGVTLRKLHQMGIRGRLGIWLASFLTGRTQTVVVSNSQSSPQPVISGVPQGSVLGPLIFLILLGNIDEGTVNSFISSFADDTRVGKAISSAEDAVLLQGDLDRIYAWAKATNMEFNSEKFEMLRYQANIKQPSPPQTLLSDIGTPIEAKSSLRDLGVTMSDDASFSQFISEKVTAVKQLSGWAMRTFKTRARGPMLTIWKSLIQCHIDYCSQLWSPYKTGEIQAVETLQRIFINKIAGMRELGYWQQLKELKLYSLERRRERYAIIYTWRILENQVPNLDNTPICAKWHIRRGRECIIPHVSTSPPSYVQAIRFSSFALRGPRLFNSMPAKVRNLTGCSPDKFKRVLDEALARIPDEPLVQGLTQHRQIEGNSLMQWAARVPRDDPPAIQEDGVRFQRN